MRDWTQQRREKWRVKLWREKCGHKKGNVRGSKLRDRMVACEGDRAGVKEIRIEVKSRTGQQ